MWRRYDFRETSRIVVLLSRDHGRLQVLAKGAHRPNSPLLGRLDFLNELKVRVSADRGGLRLLVRAELLRERRTLRQPARYLAASYWVELCNYGFPDDRPDPDLFDLVSGGLTLIERCPPASVQPFVLGLELRFLAHLGALPDLERCADCSAPLGEAAYLASAGGLACRAHAPAPRRAIANRAWEQLRQLATTPGRRWPELDLGPLAATAIELPALWLMRALERRSRLRSHVFRQARKAPGAHHGALDTDRA